MNFNKKWLVFGLSFAIFSAVPLSVSAQSNDLETSDAVFNHVIIPQAYIDGIDNGILDEHGEFNDFSFPYDLSEGNQVRIEFVDKDQVGITFKVYDPNNKQVVAASGHTTKTNKYKVTKTFRPRVNGDYRVAIVSDDGTGGHGFSIKVRSL